MNIIPGFSAASNQRIITKNLKFWLEASFPSSAGSTSQWPNVMTETYDGVRPTCNFALTTPYSTDYNGYYDFNVFSSYGQTGAFSDIFSFGTNPFTIEIWALIILTEESPFFKTICSIGQYTDGILFRHQPDEIPNDALYFAGIAWNWDAPTYMPSDTWKHLVISKQGTSFNLYVNGISVLDDTTPSINGGSVPEDITPAVPDSYIGASSHNPEETWPGYISSYRVYNGTALTQAEVLNNFNATRIRFGV